MSSTVDRRILRTRKKLRIGLATLLQQKPLSEITIRELSEISGVNRGTFYLHFTGIADMVESFHQESTTELCAICDRYTLEDLSVYPKPFFVELMSYLNDNEDVCMSLFCRNDNYAFLENMVHYMVDYFFSRVPDSTMIDRKSSRYALQFLIAGVGSVLTHWHRNGKVETPEQMARILHGLLHPTAETLRE